MSHYHKASAFVKMVTTRKRFIVEMHRTKAERICPKSSQSQSTEEGLIYLSEIKVVSVHCFLLNM